MQRYHPANCTGAVNNNAISGTSVRADSSSLSNNFSVGRRQPPLGPYKLKCDKEPLNSRLGPPDFHPQTPNCPEETLTREYVQSGYRESVEGVEEPREISLTQIQVFSKPVTLKCREALRKYLRAINESRAQKRKAGQVYGVPLSGSLLTKHGAYPEQRPCGEEFKKKWIEGLSQPHKRLRHLVDHVPHGYRKKSLFEVLIVNNVPLPRATWFIKITYLNQVRPTGTTDKSQLLRSELWTKDVVDYLQILLDELLSRNGSHRIPHNRDRPAQMILAASAQQNGEDPSIHFKWWYMVRLLHWHYSEGLLLPSVIIDWVLSQLQEKDLLEILQLLLPIIYGVLDAVVLSQTYVRTLLGIAIRYISQPSPGGSDLVDNSRRAYTTAAAIEMLRYLILAVPDTFVALDCFPLPPSMVSYSVNEGAFVSKASDETRKIRDSSAGFKIKRLDAQYQSVSFGQVVSSIQKRADNIAKATCPGYLVHNVAKAVQALDKALLNGDVREAYSFLFENFCDGAVDDGWIEDVSPCLKSSLKWLPTVNLSYVCSVFFLCEWATCDYQDFRTAAPHDLKFTGRKDLSQVYIAARLLKLKLRDFHSKSRWINGRLFRGSNNLSNSQHNSSVRDHVGSSQDIEDSSTNSSEKIVSLSDVFESPGPLHDIIVCWIDQHEVLKGEGSKRLQLFMGELIRSGIFYPHSYARQLLISGIMDINVHATDLDRRKRHYQILKQFPGNFLQDILEEAKIAEDSELLEAINVYSNERRLLLHGAICKQYQYPAKLSVPIKKEKHNLAFVKDNPSLDQLKAFENMLGSGSLTSKKSDANARIEGLKASISLLLQIPNLSDSSETGLDESQGSVKRAAESTSSTVDSVEATPGCEDCRKAKKQKLSEGRSSSLQGQSPISDNENTWWMQKGSKPLQDSSKVDMQLKPSKPVTKSRQKVVRKTQSLAQLAAARIEGSHGASTSHVCNNRVSCSHHRTGVEGEILKPADVIRTLHGGDIVVIAKELEKLRFVEKRCITVWLLGVVKQLIGDTEKNTAQVGQISGPSVPADDKSPIRWKLGEGELSAILYLMDVCNDFVSASKLLLSLLPKVASNPNSTILTGRNMMMLQKNGETHPCEVGEVFLLSCLRRYENVLVATDLIPDVLEIALQRVAVLLASSGRVSGSAALTYSRHLMKKYGNLPIVSEWEKNFRAKCDKRLISELDPGRPQDREFGYPLGMPAGIEDLDDFFRQKITGNRMSRAGMSMKELVQRHIEDAFNYFSGRARKVLGSTPKGLGLEKSDGGHQIAQQIVIGLMECIRQTGGAAQEGDPSLVSSAVAAIVSNVGPTMAKMPDITTHSNATSATASLSLARRILCIHMRCLCLLKEAFGERQSRVFEVSLATEASSALAAAFAHGKASRSQFQLSPEESISSEASARAGRGTKSVAAISALVVGAVIHGVTSLERMVTVFRLKEGLDVIQFIRSTRSNSNGNVRSVLGHKADNSFEIYVHWFRLLISNCRTLSDGLIVELLGEPSIVALSRMQRMLPLSLVFPPAYSVFAFVVWRQIILSKDLANREDINQLYQSLTVAITDAIRHLPFRDVCLRDSQGFYDLVVADVCDAEFASMLNGLDVHTKSSAFIPLRGRLFLNSIIDCKIPLSVSLQEENNSRVSGNKMQHGENNVKLLEKLVNGLDTLQPAKFHWQWVELRLLLNEQALIEKLETHDMSLVDAIRSSSPDPEKSAASENENNFIVIILTRLLVRPDAAPLFSELVHLFGRALEDSMLLQAKWFLGGHDVLLGRKTIRQRLTNIAESKNLSMKDQFSKPWGWNGSSSEPVKGGKKKLEAPSLEEGEVVEDTKRVAKGSNPKQCMTERAFIELVHPCIDQGSDESRNTFASDLIKQLNNIEQQINAVGHGVNKQAGSGSSGFEGPAIKGNNRKITRGGNPGMSRRATVTADSSLPSPAALRASMSLRLQLLLRVLPVICANGEPSGRNMRHMLASVIIRLIGNRIVHEDADLSLYPFQNSQSKIEVESAVEFASPDLSGECLFDRLLVVLHALLSNALPNWLKPRSASKLNELSKESSGVDREVVESLQNELDRMQLPGSVRWRIQAAMPILLPSVRFSLSCQIPTVPVAAVLPLQQNASTPLSHSANPPHKTPAPLPRTMNLPVKSKPSAVLPTPQDNDPEIDPWTLLEDGAGSGPSSGNASVAGSGDHTNLRASCWLKGAVRVRRTDLSYIGSIDDDS